MSDPTKPPMTAGMLTFDGTEYPDGVASDPNRLGLMQGSPPATDKLVRFAGDQALQFPQIRWALSHMRELVPTANVGRGDGAPSNLGAVNAATAQAIDALQFQDLSERQTNWHDSLDNTYTDGIVVLHRGQRVYERYLGALQGQAQRQHACFSITKSYVATLAAMLVHEGVLDEHQCVPFYLPEMANTAYADVTVRNLLDMQVGVAYSEDYADPKAHIWDYARAGGFLSRPADYSGPGTFYEFLQTLKKEGEHGEAFAYKTVNTELLCWVMKRVTGVALADMLAERVWSRIGCEQDASLTVDSTGVAFGGGGLNASLRDLARFGELMRCHGSYQGSQVIPAAVVEDIRNGSDPAKFAKAGYVLLPGYSYRNMWWVAHNDMGVFEARGIHGQRLYVSPKAEMVIARFGSHPVASSYANDPITLPAFAALGRMLMNGV